MEKFIPIADVYFTAYASCRKIPFSLRKTNGRVSFLFPANQKFYQAFESYETAEIPVNEYVSELKKLKARMFALRDDEQ